MRPRMLALLAVLLTPASAGAAVHRHPCEDAPGGTRCGSLRVPLDRSGAVRGTVKVEFERYLRRERGRPALGTMLAIEGGPGFSTTDSRDSYLKLLGRRCGRGATCCSSTCAAPGCSGALDCKTFAPHVRRLRGARGAMRGRARAAARLLRHGQRGRRHRRGARRAADPAGRPLRRLLRLLRRARRSRRATRDRLRSLVLDGTYPRAGHRPGVRRPRRGDAARAAARVRAAPELRGARRGPGGRRRAARRRGSGRGR